MQEASGTPRRIGGAQEELGLHLHAARLMRSMFDQW